MPVCSFCKNGYEFPRGTTVVQKDGSPKYFCSSKCRKNSEMGRLAKKVKWIKKSDIIKAEREKHEAGKVVAEEMRVEEKKRNETKKAEKKAKKVEKK